MKNESSLPCRDFHRAYVEGEKKPQMAPGLELDAFPDTCPADRDPTEAGLVTGRAEALMSPLAFV